ncbi:hypothetical protein A3E17_04525 [Candidatus Amesbacteria bacterium RIFCSPHIGHO2_12_FULL_48_14]|uniref:Uncharacterized protein n=1 Tax=Candidatus Amesbacteria bacterium RIFCSPHIGHO2_12_FULL_48_14 TaxID=1797257 RepID=A0A1F4Z7A3_9BACT|nr:MAG: hypothetical protein A2V48_00965 [Candidatus Amesbacteria bacterium RBG_19FT_COMBO_48_16]OGC97672.1 MAG: hypothetical protein A2W16_01320 [Candidatus Amesbacteria bacterium RBG_16_48_31]OGD02043.1 MAG: hypothetical protein A3E17_04525 [Candidatus Amesbacteria bacterium RIFCSPHIGHO2_12_FULL_48_14]OGD07229.1 MAG: hypothetical protein A3B58_01515 [Candidatus Amesbacteria bacterium RIFCSPLOWO2_01_FULL_48_50]
MKKETFLSRIQKTTLTDLFGKGENLRRSVVEMLREMPQDQNGENFRRLLREVLETESGVTGEEIADEERLGRDVRKITDGGKRDLVYCGAGYQDKLTWKKKLLSKNKKGEVLIH